MSSTASKGKRAKQETVDIDRLWKAVNTTKERKWFLRAPDESTWRGYASNMLDGHQFPPSVIGQVIDEKGNMVEFSADGVHRGYALHHLYSLANGLELSKDDAKQAEKLTDEQRELIGELTDEIPVQIVQYASVQEAMTDQLRRNQAQGRGLAEKDRDRRIIWMVRKPDEINPKTKKPYDPPGLGMKMADVAAEVGLSESSVSRIARGEQNVTGKMKGGRGNAPAKPMDADAIGKACEKIVKALANVDNRQEVTDSITTDQIVAYKATGDYLIEFANEAAEFKAAVAKLRKQQKEAAEKEKKKVANA